MQSSLLKKFLLLALIFTCLVSCGENDTMYGGFPLAYALDGPGDPLWIVTAIAINIITALFTAFLWDYAAKTGILSSRANLCVWVVIGYLCLGVFFSPLVAVVVIPGMFFDQFLPGNPGVLRFYVAHVINSAVIFSLFYGALLLVDKIPSQNRKKFKH